MNTLMETNVRLFASANSWIEGEAVRQLYAGARLAGVRLAAGFPDLHPGKSSPVGAAFVTEGVIYPHLIGGDIGCGMALFKTSLSSRDAERSLTAGSSRRSAERVAGLPRRSAEREAGLPRRSAKREAGLPRRSAKRVAGLPRRSAKRVAGLPRRSAKREAGLPRRSAKRVGGWPDLRFDLEHPWEGDVGEVLAAAGLEPTEFDEALGTIGGGNHFAELQKIEEVLDVSAFRRLGLGKQQLVALVHSGSRGLGESILRAFVHEHQAKGADSDSFAAAGYLRDHDAALRWAKANRALIARRFAEALGAEAECLWDACHNSITRYENEGQAVWVHRKGAVAADGEPVMIPGSRGSLSYLVKPIGDGADHAWSLAHGAGRKWARSETRLRMRERFAIQQLTETPLGGRVICEPRELLYEEAPAAYKNIEDVVADLVQAGLVSVIATFRPLLTYKTRSLRR